MLLRRRLLGARRSICLLYTSQGRDVAADDALSLAGFEHASDDLEHGGLARTVGANQADGHDAYGGTLENRMRFMRMCLDEVMDAAGIAAANSFTAFCTRGLSR